jgi:hypothetical protein
MWDPAVGTPQNSDCRACTRVFNSGRVTCCLHLMMLLRPVQRVGLASQHACVCVTGQHCALGLRKLLQYLRLHPHSITLCGNQPCWRCYFEHDTLMRHMLWLLHSTYNRHVLWGTCGNTQWPPYFVLLQTRRFLKDESSELPDAQALQLWVAVNNTILRHSSHVLQACCQRGRVGNNQQLARCGTNRPTCEFVQYRNNDKDVEHH